MARRAKQNGNGHDDARMRVGGNNPFDDPFTDEAIARFEELEAEAKSIMAEAMLRVKEKRADQREIMGEAKERGLNTKALRAHLKQRELERKIDKVRDKLESDDQDALDLLKQYLGVLADTPLGQAAMEAAGAS